MARKVVSKKARTKKKDRGYGMVKVPSRSKLAFISHENKHGWSLGLALPKRTYWLKNVRFASQKEVTRAMSSSVIFVPKNK